MANQLENFDELLKNAMDGAEAPFNESHWKELEDELNIVSPSVAGYFSAISTGVVATSLVFALMLFMLSDGSQPEVISEIEVIENNDGLKGAGQNANSEQAQIASAESKSSDSKSIGVEGALSNSENSENNNDVEKSEIEKTKGDKSDKNELTEVSNKNTTTKPTKGNKGDKKDSETVVASSTEISAEKSNVRKGCTGLTIAFDASEEYGANARYLWNFGDGYFSNEANPSHTFNKEGVFDVSLSVTSSASGQITSNVVQAMIEIEEAPIANVDLLISGPNTISFNNKSFNANDVEWNLNGEIYGNGSSISMSVADNTNYSLQLSAINDGGCVDTLLTKINSIKAGSEFPRAIDTSYGTPFAPGAILDEGEVTSVKIYNQKSGELVFEGSGNKGWNGNLPSGNKADKGNYQWIMAVEQQNTVDIYHGDLELR
jgi:PKD repeat protein